RSLPSAAYVPSKLTWALIALLSPPVLPAALALPAENGAATATNDVTTPAIASVRIVRLILLMLPVLLILVTTSLYLLLFFFGLGWFCIISGARQVALLMRLL